MVLGLPEGVPGTGWRLGPEGTTLVEPARISIEVQNSPPGVFEPMMRLHRRTGGGSGEWTLLPGDGARAEAPGDSLRVSSDSFEIDTEWKVAGIRPSPASQVSTGDGHVCVLSRDDTLYCWGANEGGQVGEEASPADGIPIPGPEGLRPVEIASGGSSSRAVDGEGELWCWGRVAAASGGDRVARYGWPNQSTIEALVVGAAHACALEGEGSILCWGSNDRGQLGSAGGAEVVEAGTGRPER